jgi:hypothetical protein
LDQLGHFRTNYDNIEHLKRDFRDQLDRMFDLNERWSRARHA